MSVQKLEALHDAIASLKGWANPESEAYQLRNPLMVKNFSRPGKNEMTDEGVRIFSSSLAGIRAGLFDLEIKIKGESRAGIKTTDTLENLLRVFGLTEKLGQDQIVKFLKRALPGENISRSTPLSYFLEDSKNGN